MKLKILPSKKCKFCKKKFNRTKINGKRNYESVYQFTKKRQYCSKRCCYTARIKPFLDDLKRCLFCEEIILRTTDKRGKLISHSDWKRRKFCTRQCWLSFWNKNRGTPDIIKIFIKGKRYSVSRKRI